MSAVLAAEAVDVDLGGASILKGIDLAVAAGEVLALLGPNGSGKSTLMKALAGLLRPRGGRVLLDGRPLMDHAPRERAGKLGYLAQDQALAWDLTVSEIVGLGASGIGGIFDLRSRMAPEALARAERLLAAMDLQPFRDRRVRTLSGGERGRVMLARVLAGEPEALLADEPAAHLDVAHQAAIMRHVRAEAAGRGMAAVVVVHDLNLAARFADRCVLLHHGQVVLDAPTDAAMRSAEIDRVFGQAFLRVPVGDRLALVAAEEAGPSEALEDGSASRP